MSSCQLQYSDLSFSITANNTKQIVVRGRLPGKIVILLQYKYNVQITWASTRETLSSVVCEQQRRRPACASAQSDQRIYYSLIGKYNI